MPQISIPFRSSWWYISSFFITISPLLLSTSLTFRVLALNVLRSRGCLHLNIFLLAFAASYLLRFSGPLLPLGFKSVPSHCPWGHAWTPAALLGTPTPGSIGFGVFVQSIFFPFLAMFKHWFASPQCRLLEAELEWGPSFALVLWSKHWPVAPVTNKWLLYGAAHLIHFILKFSFF